MRKKLYLYPLFLLGFFLFATTSCMDGDNDDKEVVDEEWKALNEINFAKVASDNSFIGVTSQSGNGKVYWKPSTVITDTDAKVNTVRITVAGKVEFTDTVVVRYEGWYFDAKGEKVIFDSTENPSLRTQIGYIYNNSVVSSPYPNYIPATFPVNPLSQDANGNVSGIIDGWATILQDMVLGEERDVCIPQELGYGKNASTYSVGNSPTFTLIPSYTTLWFRIKIFEIKQMKGLK